jgi:hypothetical protein
MMAFLSRRLRRWLLFAVGLPLFGGLLEAAGAALEQRSGETKLTRSMRGARRTLRRYERGPLARRHVRGG